jgi:hypothetical protein
MDVLEREVAAGRSSSGIVTDRMIMIDVTHPEVPVLDLVDLPGMVHVEDPKYPGKMKAVEEIYNQQILKDTDEGRNAIYLVLVPAPSQTNAPDHNPVLQYIKDRGITDRTIGVFTHADDSPAEHLHAYITGEPLKGFDERDGSEKEEAPRGHVNLGNGWTTTSAPRLCSVLHQHVLAPLSRTRRRKVL